MSRGAGGTGDLQIASPGGLYLQRNLTDIYIFLKECCYLSSGIIYNIVNGYEAVTLCSRGALTCQLIEI